MPLEIHKLRRLSVFFTNGEAVAVELDALDVWDPNKLEIVKPSGETWYFVAQNVSYWRLLPFERAVEVGAPPKPVRKPEPELELR